MHIDNREFLKDAFVHVDHPDQLRQGIKRALNPTPAMQTAANHHRDYFFFGLDGKASKRTKALIEKLYAEGTHFNDPTS